MIEKKIACLGPKYSNGYLCLKGKIDCGDINVLRSEVVLYDSNIAVLIALDTGAVDYAFVPIRNNIGDIVGDVVSRIQSGTNSYELLYRCRYPITHNLFVRNAAVRLEEIKVVCSHRNALAQCSYSDRQAKTLIYKAYLMLFATFKGSFWMF